MTTELDDTTSEPIDAPQTPGDDSQSDDEQIDDEQIDASFDLSGEAGSESDAQPEAEEPVDDPWTRPGAWYVVHTQSGYEKKVSANLTARIQSMNMEEKIYEIVIPMEDVEEFKNGRKQTVQKKVFPGYLLVRCVMDDDSWYCIRNTPGVTGFVGQSKHGQKPTPLSRREVQTFLAAKGDGTGGLAPRKKPKVDFDPDAENKLVAAICYSHSSLPESALLERVRRLGVDEKLALIRAYVGARGNRRHKPGRAFERVDYRFDVLSDYGAFRDLQRHRLLTIEWQALTPNHGYTRPDLVDAAGVGGLFTETMERSARLYDDLKPQFPEQASYAVAMAFRLRYAMQFNAREAIHLIELRSAPQGHPSYRRVVLEMHRLIAEQAGHRAVAEAMQHLTTEAPELERLASERRAEQRRGGDAPVM